MPKKRILPLNTHSTTEEADRLWRDLIKLCKEPGTVVPFNKELVTINFSSLVSDMFPSAIIVLRKRREHGNFTAITSQRNKTGNIVIDMYALTNPFDFRKNGLIDRVIGELQIGKFAFIHELTHLLDYNKEDLTGTVNNNPRQEEGDDLSEYYNRPLEFNAFYQVGAHSIKTDKWYQRFLTTRVWPKEVPSSNFFFKRWARRKYFEPEWVKALNSYNKRLLNARLEAIYNEIRWSSRV